MNYIDEFAIKLGEVFLKSQNLSKLINIFVWFLTNLRVLSKFVVGKLFLN